MKNVILLFFLTFSVVAQEKINQLDAQGNRPRIGQLLLTIDPGLAGGHVFAKKMQEFLKTLASDSGTRVPGARRFKQRASGFKQGVNVSDVVVEEIRAGIRQSWS